MEHISEGNGGTIHTWNTIQNVVSRESYIEFIIVNQYVLFIYFINIPIDTIIIINFFGVVGCIVITLTVAITA